MSVRAEIRAAVLALVAIQVVTAFGAIALLGSHAGPALAAAGAWAMVILALVGLGASAVVLRRLTVRVAAPVARIDDALAGAGRGDPFRRIRLEGVPADLDRIAGAISAVMDAHAGGEGDPRAIAAADRAALLHLLDGMPAPALVVDRRGVPTAASATALARLAADDGGALRRALSLAATGAAAPGVASAAKIGDGALCLCTLAAQGR